MRAEMGYPIIVTPVSQHVATQAVRNVIDQERWSNVSDETDPLLPRALRRAAGARGRRRRRARALAAEVRTSSAALEPVSLEGARARFGRRISDEELLLRLTMPQEQVDAIGAFRAGGRCHCASPPRRGSRGLYGDEVAGRGARRPAITHLRVETDDELVEWRRSNLNAARIRPLWIEQAPKAPGRHNQGMTDLERARAAYEERSWLDAYEAFARADEETPLDAEDLELYSTTARMLGRDDDALAALERAHHGYLERGETRRAAYCAGWIGMSLFYRGAVGPAGGWLARAHRLIEDVPEETVEHGYVLLPAIFRKEAVGDFEAPPRLPARQPRSGSATTTPDLMRSGDSRPGPHARPCGPRRKKASRSSTRRWWR